LPIRAAVIAESADDLAAKLADLRSAIIDNLPAADKRWAMPRKGVYVGNGSQVGRIGFLFPGQGSSQLLMARTLIERFDWARQLAEEADSLVMGRTLLDVIYRPIDRARNSSEIDGWAALLSATEVAQPAICLASVLCVRFLHSIGIQPVVVGGHSLGELTALHVAGAFDTETLFSIASLRGQVMCAVPERAGAMVSLACPRAEAEEILSKISGTVVVANINSPNQTVVSGDVDAINAVITYAADHNIQCRRLSVSNAFHSPLMAHSAELFEADFKSLSSLTLSVPVISGVESTSIDDKMDLRQHLTRQITSPVNFVAMAKEMKDLCDVFIEVGPGRTLSGLCRDIFGEDDICTPVAANALAWNPNPAVAVAFVNGASIDWQKFYAKRLIRTYISPSARLYLSNPAENPITLNGARPPLNNLSALTSEQSLEGTLSRELGLNALQLKEYLRRRGNFIAGVVRLDMMSLTSSAEQPAFEFPKLTPAVQPAPSSRQAPVVTSAAGKTSVKDVATLLINLISKRTGYPETSITPDSRLLDDLNLDSIKAGELVAEALRRIGAAGAIDATRFANSSIQSIATSLYEVAPEAAPAIMATESLSQGNDEAPVRKTSVDSVVELLIDLTSLRTGYPSSSITAESRLLDDLNLDSIKAGELVAEALRRIGAAGAIDATRFANSSLRDIAIELGEALPTNHLSTVNSRSPVPVSPQQRPTTEVSGADLSFVSRYTTWTRNFVVHAVPMPREGEKSAIGEYADGSLANTVFLIFFDPRDRAPADALCAEIQARGGLAEQTPFDTETGSLLQRDNRFTHQIAVLPRSPSENTPEVRVAEMISRVTSLVQAPVKDVPAERRTIVAYVQFGDGTFGSDAFSGEPELCNTLAFARTLHLERKDLRVRVLDFAKSTASSTIAKFVLEEISGGESFSAVGFDTALIRRVPFARLNEPVTYQPRLINWSERDVILVTGGAKGIMAECALGVARETGATLVLIGRGEPVATKGSSGDGEIDHTLERFRAEGLRHLYFSCDIVDPNVLADVVRKIEAEAGTITGVIHGASILRPCRTDNLTVDGLRQEISPKVLGAWNLCRVLNGRPLKLFVAFSSLVVDHGMPWSSGYAFANELMERIVQNAAVADLPIPLQIVSFGLWGNVGRPAVLKTNDHLLSVGLHDGEIPPEEGVRRFVEMFMLDPGVRRLCIYGRSVGYATWDQLRPKPTIPANLRFIERVIHVEPDVELIARCHLTLQQDQYLHGHIYNGMYIVPTVLALEAIAQAAYALVGDKTPLCRLEAIEMPYPIVVDPNNGLEIELRVEVQQSTAIDGLQRVNVSVSTEQTAFKTRALSGVVVFGSRRAEVRESASLGKPISINARADLYGRQFFVGSMYQRMGEIYSVDPAETICIGDIYADKDAAREAFNDPVCDQLVLGDPFFRDTLLHTSLLHHLDHMAFTSRIDKIEFFEGCESVQASQRLCFAHLQWAGDKDAEYELVAASPSGRIFERWTGFCTKALAHTETWPTLQDLLDIDRTKAIDERELSKHVTSAAGQLGVIAPFVGLECINGFADFPVEERHIQEQALFARYTPSLKPGTALPSLQWMATGRPRLETEADLDISFSHEGWYCLCTVGSDAQGCDLAVISPRSKTHWLDLFGSARTHLLDSLGAEEPLDTAGTRIWAALEAARKAIGTDDEELTAVQRVNTNVLFCARTPDKEVFILTLPIRFSHGQQSIVALTVKKPARALASLNAPYAPSVRIMRDESLGCDVLEYEFSVSWKECTTPTRKAMSTCYVDWFHRVREAMLPQQDAYRWVAGVVDGTAGLVARSIRVQLYNEATAHDELCARIWMVNLSEGGARWRVDFYKMLPNSERKLVAMVEAEGGMVEASGTGSQSHAVSNIMRDYGRFAQSRTSIKDVENNADFDRFQRGRPLFEVPVGPRGGPLLFVETMRPSLIDSDLVGNVSSITFFVWLAHVRDRFLHSVVPGEMVRRVGASSKGLGEALCLEEDMVYLREALPFDEITIEMKLIAATERSVRIRYEFVRTKQEVSEKVAIGHQQLLWVHRDDDDSLHSENFPAELLKLLSSFEQIEHSEIPQMLGVS